MDYATPLQLAKDALVRALQSAGGEPLLSPGYSVTFRQNVVAAIPDEAVEEIANDLAKGDGAELSRDQQGRAKACAAYSSSALAANSFGGWCGKNLAALRLLSRDGFTNLAFEGKFPTGLPGKGPNLDVVLEQGRTLIAVESKCLEYLTPKRPAFEDSYTRRFHDLASPAWLRCFEEVSRRTQVTSPLDTAQLLRHYLGLKNACAATSGKYDSATLLYLFWEPLNASDYPEFGAHREAIEEFAAGLEDPHITFVSLSYPDLWAAWRTDGAPWLAELLSQIAQRYLVAIG